MKVSFAAVGVLLVSAAQALPLLETNKSHVAQAKNSTAPVTRNHNKRSVKILDAWPTAGNYDDALMGFIHVMAERFAYFSTQQPLSSWDDKENSRFESNSWALGQHELNIIEELSDATGKHA